MRIIIEKIKCILLKAKLQELTIDEAKTRIIDIKTELKDLEETTIFDCQFTDLVAL